MTSRYSNGRATSPKMLIVVCLAIFISTQPMTCRADSLFALTRGGFRIPSDRPIRECAIERECTELEGSCVASAECDGNLVCGLENCIADSVSTFSGEPMQFNCCVHKCGFRGDMFALAANSECCTEALPCGVNQGDCDNDDQCGSGLICGSSNCPWGGTDDCCMPAPEAPFTPVIESTCTRENQCGENEGDCDSNTDCESDLVCGANNCGLLPNVMLGLDSSADCCVRPCGYTSPFLGTPFHPATDCCDRNAPCNVGEGNCNAHDECSGDSVCLDGTCPWGGSGHCCAPKCESALSGHECCTDERPCGLAEGECELDSQCQIGLSCLGLCPWGTGLCCAPTPTDPPSVSPTFTPTLTPSEAPTLLPTVSPSEAPSVSPTEAPTDSPTLTPTSKPTFSPTDTPTLTPSEMPSSAPTETPTSSPTLTPSTTPTYSPTDTPTLSPSETPSTSPTEAPTASPSISPSLAPTETPTEMPTLSPSASPSESPTDTPTVTPSETPSTSPSETPTESPTSSPSYSPSASPTDSPTLSPSETPSTSPTETPTTSPTLSPSTSPSSSPTDTPSLSPSYTPSESPTDSPTLSPSETPSTSPTETPTASPTLSPSASPSASPTDTPSLSPSYTPSESPTDSPTLSPSGTPSASPSETPTSSPTLSPSYTPSSSPTDTPTSSPSVTPSASPSETPTASPTLSPSTSPSSSPTDTPTLSPSGTPSASPSETPTSSPTLPPSYTPTASPTDTPTSSPSETPSSSPSEVPTVSPTSSPSTSPTSSPTNTPSQSPSLSPSDTPTTTPTGGPTIAPSPLLTARPTAPTWSPTSSASPTSDQDCSTVVAQEKACMGCRKDYFTGAYVFCNGIFPGSAVDYCSFFGGPGNCTFPPQQDLSIDQCEELCAEEPGCLHFSWVENGACRLHLMTECEQMQSYKSTLASFDVEQCYIGPEVTNQGGDSTPAPTSSVPNYCRASEIANGFTCEGCHKNIALGQYIGCDGVSDVNATKTNCDEFGGDDECTFAPQFSVGPETCEAMCRGEVGCKHFTSWDTGVCILHLTSECNALTPDTSSPLVLFMGLPTSNDCTVFGADEDRVSIPRQIDSDGGDIPPLPPTRRRLDGSSVST